MSDKTMKSWSTHTHTHTRDDKTTTL